MYRLNKPEVRRWAGLEKLDLGWDNQKCVYPNVLYVDTASSGLKVHHAKVVPGLYIKTSRALMISLVGFGELVIQTGFDLNGNRIIGMTDARPNRQLWTYGLTGEPELPGVDTVRWHPEWSRALAQRALLTVEAACIYALWAEPNWFGRVSTELQYTEQLWHHVGGVPFGTDNGRIDLRSPDTYI